MADITKTLELMTEERMCQYYIYGFETRLKLRNTACSEVTGRHIETGVVICDLTGFGASKMGKQVYNFMKIAGQISNDYYPELLG